MADAASSDPLLYDLVGVVLHSGSGGHAGHYISLVRDQLHESQWSPAEVASASASSSAAVAAVAAAASAGHVSLSSSSSSSPFEDMTALRSLPATELLRRLLRRCPVDPEHGVHCATPGELSAHIVESTGTSWNKLHKPLLRLSLSQFAKQAANSEDFFVIPGPHGKGGDNCRIALIDREGGDDGGGESAAAAAAATATTTTTTSEKKQEASGAAANGDAANGTPSSGGGGDEWTTVAKKSGGGSNNNRGDGGPAGGATW